jgi:epoxyqueuosine reductase
MEIEKLQSEVRAELKNRGFAIIRFTRPPLGELGEKFSEWLDRGFAGEMAYLERRKEERLQPQRLLEDLRSLIVLGHLYDSGLPGTSDPEKANISRYAWGDDYHEVLKDKLASFQAWLERQAEGVRCFASVDASPVLEKAWAQKAGAGWLGKHTNLIHSEKGSYFFLSVLLTNLPFAEDETSPDHCGTCDRCIQACPTGAIVAPYLLDARLCISYLTIELKGPIPRELRPLIGNRIFGCDDCQQVCPWNRFSAAASEERFRPRPWAHDRPLAEFLTLTETAFRERFAGTPLLRPKRRGFLRNVLVAIGNSGNSAFAPAVAEKFSDPEPLVRGHAVWAYARLLVERARSRLETLREWEKDPFVLEEIEVSLMSTAQNAGTASDTPAR